MSKLPHVTRSQHERTVDIIRCQAERIWPNQYRHSAITSIDVVTIMDTEVYSLLFVALYSELFLVLFCREMLAGMHLTNAHHRKVHLLTSEASRGRQKTIAAKHSIASVKCKYSYMKIFLELPW